MREPTLQELEAEYERRFGKQEPARKKEPQWAATSAAKGFAQGVGQGFLDEILGGITAAGSYITDPLGEDSLYTGGIFDRYRQARDDARDSLNQASEDNPLAYGGGQLAGAVGSAVAASPFKAVNPSTVKGMMGVGAGFGGVNAAGYSEAGLLNDPGQLAIDTAKGAAFGAGTAGVIGGTAKGIKGVVNSRRVAQAKKSMPIMAADDVFAMTHNTYATVDAADAAGAALKPVITNAFISKAEQLTPQTTAGKAVAGDSAFTQVVERIKTLKDQPISLRAAQEIDEALGDAIDSNMLQGRLTKEGKKILDIQTTFRQVIDAAKPNHVVGGKAGFEALKQGRALWSSAAKLRDIEKIVARAELTDNPAIAMKSGFRTLASNPARMRGFSPEEQALIRKAAETRPEVDALRVIASRLNPIIAFSGGGGIGKAAAAHGVASVARQGATKLQSMRADDVARAITGRVTGNLPVASTATPILDGFAGAAAKGGAELTGMVGASEREAAAASQTIDSPQPSPATGIGARTTPAMASPMREPTLQELEAEYQRRFGGREDMSNTTIPPSIERDEGRRLAAYDDHLGNRTVGVGFNMDSGIARKVWQRAGVPVPFDDVYAGKAALSDVEANRLARESVQIAVDDASSLYPNMDELSPARQEALVGLSYQLGKTTLAGFEDFNASVRRGEFVKAARHLLKS